MQAIERQAILDETTLLYNKFVANLEVEVNLSDSEEQETTTCAISRQSQQDTYHQLQHPTDNPTAVATHLPADANAPAIHPELPLSSTTPPPSISHYKQLTTFFPNSDSVPTSDGFQGDSEQAWDDSDCGRTGSSMFSSNSLEDLSHLYPITHSTPLIKAASLDNLSSAYSLKEALLSVPCPVTRLFTYYSLHLSPTQYLLFLRETGNIMQKKLQKASSSVQQNYMDFLENGGQLYPSIIKHYPSSEWLVHSLEQELIQDNYAKANPITLEHFNNHWTSLSQRYPKDQQIELLHALWEAKQCAGLTLLQLTHILEIVAASGKTGYDMVCREQPDKLVHLKYYWLSDQVSSLPQFASSASDCSQLTDALAYTQLSPAFIPSLLSAIREENDLPSLLNFLSLIKKRAVPEFIILSIIYEKNCPLAAAENKPQQWIISLLCQLSLMHLSQIDSYASDAIAPTLYKQISLVPSIAPVVEDFIYKHSKLIAATSSTFIELLELLHNYQIKEVITADVFKQLAEEEPAQWIAKADRIITTNLFQPSHTYSVEELIQQIDYSALASLYSSQSTDKPDQAAYYLKKATVENVLKQQIVENLKPSIKKQLKEVQTTYEKELEILEERQRAVKENIEQKEEKCWNLERCFNSEKDAYKSASGKLKEEEIEIKGELEKIKKEKEGKLKNSDQEVKTLEHKLEELGKKPEEASKNPSAQRKEKSNAEKLTERLNLVIAERAVRKSTYLKEKESYEASVAELVARIKSLKVNQIELEAKQKPIKVKIEKLSQEDATNFLDYNLYKEVLDSFCKAIANCRSYQKKPLSQWSESEITTWSKQIKSSTSTSLFRSHNVTEIVAGFNQAAILSHKNPLTQSQQIELLSILFPFYSQHKKNSTKESLVIIALATICALQAGQISLVTDSKKWPISESAIAFYLPLFKLFDLTATQRDRCDPSASCNSHIVYGKIDDFQPILQLIAYNALEQKQRSIDSSYHSPSAILQAAEAGTCNSFKEKPISSWVKQEVSQWANYVQSQNSNPECTSQGAIAIESIAVTQRAAELIQTVPLTPNKRCALVALLYPSLDKGQLLHEAQKDNLVVAMFAAIRSLQARQTHITPSKKLAGIKQQKPLFDLLNLNIAARQNPSSANLSSILTKASAKAEEVKALDQSDSHPLLSHEQLYNVIRIIYPHLYAGHVVRLDLVGPAHNAIDTLRIAIVQHIQNKTSQLFTSLVQVGGNHWATVAITQEKPALYHAYYANSVNDQDQDNKIEAALADSGIQTIHKLQVSLQQDRNTCSLYAIAHANAITKAIKSGKTNDLLSHGIAITPAKIKDLQQKWTTILDNNRNKILTLGQDVHYIGRTIELVAPLSTSAAPNIVTRCISSDSIFSLGSRSKSMDPPFGLVDENLFDQNVLKRCSSSGSIFRLISRDSSSTESMDSASGLVDENLFTTNVPTRYSNSGSICSVGNEANNKNESTYTPSKLSPAHEQVSKLYNSIDQCYKSPSCILQNSSFNFKQLPISQWEEEEVTAWATYMQSNYKPGLEIELIAGIKRAVELTHKFHPWPTQLVSLLTLLPSGGKGRLAQVNTGEGKSLIIAMLAAIHGLQLRQVDVITTSTELSIPEVIKQTPFFKLLNLTVAENSESSDKVAAYKSQIVYGTANDFQADILKKEFLGEDVRGERGCDIVLVDEVDSLLYDNRSYSVRLSSSNPGMDDLKLVLGAIWQYIQWLTNNIFEGKDYFTTEESILADTFITEQTQRYLESLIRTLDPTEKQEYEIHFEKRCAIARVEQEIRELYNDKELKAERIAFREQLQEELIELPWNNRAPILDIPQHLRYFAQIQLPHWIKNCLKALFVYKERAHYTVENGRIVPIQHSETGVLQHNLVWSDGLNQFLQMKEGLAVDAESISTNFLSNVGFFKRYSKSIYGLTGTLGESATRSFLEELYNVDFVVIPPFRRRIIQDNSHTLYLCKELRPIVVENKAWYPAILYHLLHHAKQGRTVLAICKFMGEAEHLEKQLRAQYDTNKVFTYTGITPFKKKVVDSGEIIIATNIAGRGTDFITSDQVEFFGGMYVALTFLPESLRVELQNVGRTARAGKKGMAQLILCNSDGNSVDSLKEARQANEVHTMQRAIPDARKSLLLEALFQHFYVENSYLPTASDCERMAEAVTVLPAWNHLLSEEFTDKKIDANFQVWSTNAKTAWHNLVSDKETPYSSQLDQVLCSKKDLFREKKRTELLKGFQSTHPTVSTSLLASLKSGQPFQPNRSNLAQKYDWGSFERKAVEERWGIWLKKQNFEEQGYSSDDILPLFERFETDFAKELAKDADADELIKNPHFYTLKGNRLISNCRLSNSIYFCNRALDCYERALTLDPIFTLHARYNKARALLSFKKNKGNKQKEAYKELKQANTLISTLYRPNLIAFHSLIGHSAANAHTGAAIQREVHLISQQEQYIQMALEVLRDTSGGKKQFHVALTTKPLRSTFTDPAAADAHTDAIREAALKGLTDLYTLEKVIPYPWFSIISMALLSLAQITIGCLLTAYGGVQYGMSLVKSGISDMIVTIKAAIKGSFDWSAWAIQRGIEIVISVASAGIKMAKEAVQNVKEGVQTTAESIKEGWLSGRQAIKDICGFQSVVKSQVTSGVTIRTVAGEVTKSSGQIVKDMLVTQLQQGAMGEVMEQAAQWCADELWINKESKAIRSRVERDLTKAFTSNKLITKALALDMKQHNSYWQQCFLQAGNEVLGELLKSNPGWQRLKQIGEGVMHNVIPHSKLASVIYGVDKALHKSDMADLGYIDDLTEAFVKKFNERIATYETEIEQSQQAEKETPKTISSSDQTTAMATPRLEEHFSNLGPSTPENLVRQLKGSICDSLIQDLQNEVRPIFSYGANWANGILETVNQENQAFLNGLKANCLYRYEKNKTEKLHKREAKVQQEKNKLKASPTTDEPKVEQQPKKIFKLEADSEQEIKVFEEGGAVSLGDIRVLGHFSERPIHIFNENGELLEVIGTYKPGEPIPLRLICNTDGKLCHIEPLNLTPTQRVQYEKQDHTQQNCALNALFVQYSKEKQQEFGDIKGLRKACADHRRKQPSLYNELFKYERKLCQIDPSQVPRFGHITEYFNPEYRLLRINESYLEQQLAEENITPEEKERREKKLSELKARKKVLEEKGNKEDEELVRTGIRYLLGAGAYFATRPIGFPLALANALVTENQARENEFEMLKTMLMYGAAGKVVGKLINMPIFKRAMGKMGWWMKNLTKQGKKFKIPAYLLNTEELCKRLATKGFNSFTGEGMQAGKYRHLHIKKVIDRYEKYVGKREGVAFEKLIIVDKDGNVVACRFDVIDTLNKVIYDFKFGKTGMSGKQLAKYRTARPDFTIKIIKIINGEGNISNVYPPSTK